MIKEQLNAYLQGDNSSVSLLIDNMDAYPVIYQHMTTATDRELWRLLALLKDSKDTNTFKVIHPYLDHPNGAIQTVVAQIMGDYSCDECVTMLINKLQPPYKMVHISIIQSLQQIGKQQALDPICNVIQDIYQSNEYEVLLYTAIDAIGALGTDNQLALLSKLSEHKSRHVREHAKQAVTKITNNHKS